MSKVEGTSMSSEDRPTSEDLEVLKQDLAALRDDLRSFVTHATNAAQARVAEAATEVGEQSRAARDSMQTKIEDHPFMAVGVALGAGLLIGAIIARRAE